MKKVFLVGKLNTVTKMMNDVMSQFYHMQLCSDNPELVKGMIRMTPPDLILISVIEMTAAHEEIFAYIHENFPNRPVICIGTEEELELFRKYLEEDQFEEMYRPLLIRKIIQRINDILNIQPLKEDGDGEVRERRKRIFLIDDSAIQLRMMKSLLEKEYVVDMAKSGVEALELMQRNIPDLIFLDYEMPECDGRTTLEMIRRIDRLASIPVVFLTGVRDRQRIQAVLSLNPAAYTLKPVSQEKLLELAHRFLDEKGADAELGMIE